MKMFFDTVIIGGGPAGCACGITLRKQNVGCCIIDKACFPRNKTCGGLVTAKTFELINALFGNDMETVSGLFCNSVSEAALYQKTKKLVQADFSEEVRFVERASFDNALIHRFLRLGGVLFENEQKYKVDHVQRQIFLSENRVICYKNIVYADGAFSSAHRKFNAGIERSTDSCCGKSGHGYSTVSYGKGSRRSSMACCGKSSRRSPKACCENYVRQIRNGKSTQTDAPEDMAFCVETFLPGDAFDLNEIRLHFGYAENGYVWVFPYGDSICVGAGGSYLKKVDFKEVLKVFLEDEGISTEGLVFKGAFCPNGSLVSQKFLPDNMLLIGDAAGFADPISGEGLYFGMLSGIAAAKALRRRNPRKAYLKMVKPVCQLIQDGQRLQQFFYRPRIQRRFVQGATGNRLFVKYYFDNQVSHYYYGYRRMLQLYLDYKKLKERNQKLKEISC